MQSYADCSSNEDVWSIFGSWLCFVFIFVVSVLGLGGFAFLVLYSEYMKPYSIARGCQEPLSILLMGVNFVLVV